MDGENDAAPLTTSAGECGPLMNTATKAGVMRPRGAGRRHGIKSSTRLAVKKEWMALWHVWDQPMERAKQSRHSPTKVELPQEDEPMLF